MNIVIKINNIWNNHYKFSINQDQQKNYYKIMIIATSTEIHPKSTNKI